YALLAASAKYNTLAELGRKRDAVIEAESLRSKLLNGRWPIRRETFEYHWAELDRLGTPAGEPPQSAFAFAVLVSELYTRCKVAGRSGASSNGRDPQPDSSLLLSNITPDHAGALLASPDWLQSSLMMPANAADIGWKILSPNARPDAGLSVTRSLSEVRLPGRIEFFNTGSTANTTNGRRVLWFAGIALMVMLVLASGYAVHRGVSQELRTSRLQSDFVAAVSHEFRSPLTTLRSISELLAQDRIADESRRRQSYVFLNHETNRLHQLVEDLLDFGRMESGRKQYRLEARDALELARATVIDFSPEAAANGFRIETNLTAASATVHADEEAFRRALRNLLENAIKYSLDCKTVWVDGIVEDHRVAISVRDCGMGIDPSEQREIFQKFVRGAAAKKAGIKGTGIGLSMVHQICRALGGEIRVESKPGAGSTFTIVLPIVEC
ncbi:MAG: HAMP domain-containing histidine kinase, partial [Acetobacteraceae bacterium]|nr:HAMP domain-containing histidine kinase [Acetobacteraceae bacterium]